MRLSWTGPALRDLAALRAYIAEENPDAARGIALTVLESAERLILFPASGRPGKKPDTRELVVPGTPYILIYRAKAEVVDILRVLHGARRWP